MADISFHLRRPRKTRDESASTPPRPKETGKDVQEKRWGLKEPPSQWPQSLRHALQQLRSRRRVDGHPEPRRSAGVREHLRREQAGCEGERRKEVTRPLDPFREVSRVGNPAERGRVEEPLGDVVPLARGRVGRRRGTRALEVVENLVRVEVPGESEEEENDSGGEEVGGEGGGGEPPANLNASFPWRGTSRDEEPLDG